MTKLELSLLAGLALASVGCATVYSKPAFQGFGEADLERDAGIIEQFKARRTGPVRPGVRVLLDTLPEGFSNQLGTLSVEKGYQHRIVGKFALAPEGGIHYLAAGFPDYEDDWRKGLCYPQSPLQWVTLGFWSLVPTDYPCHPEAWRKKTALAKDARLLAEITGADAVLMSFVFPRDDEAMGAAGVLVKLDPRMSGAEPKAPVREARREMR